MLQASTWKNDDEFVAWCYRRLLRREPDAEGCAGWVKILKGGCSRAEVIRSFIDSPEYQIQQWRFQPPGHFYDPKPNEAEITAHLARPSHSDSIPGIDLREQEQFELLGRFIPLYRRIPIQEFRAGTCRYRFPNESYPIGDAVFLLCMLQHFRPRRLVEIGCGNSSCAILEGRDRFLDRKLDYTLIEPFPEFLQRLAGNELLSLDLRQSRLQAVDLSLFSGLEENDILFIDSTHVSKLDSDVNRLFFEILPVLKPGVIIHIHDIFWPFEYPREWIQEGRAWNEQYLLRAFLQYNLNFEVLLFTSWAMDRFEGWMRSNMPAVLEERGGSIWLRRHI